jgi:hypothetical protein
MTWLADNALPIWATGIIGLTMALVVYSQTRSSGSLAAVALIVLITGALLLVERWIETPREAVERTLYELAATVEANDVAGALSYLAPAATPEIRREIERQMPQVKIERARVMGSPIVEVAGGPDPAAATVQCRGIIIAVHKHNGIKGVAEDELTLEFVRSGDRWLVADYSSKENWDRPLGR